MYLKSHETSTIEFRNPDFGAPSAWVIIYDRNGDRKSGGDPRGDPSWLASAAWSPETDAWVYFSVGDPVEVRTLASLPRSLATVRNSASMF